MPLDDQQPLVSIIMPVFNAERTLDVALASATTQTLTSIEIVCVNDGSTDTSGEILSRWALQDPRLRVFDQPNSGVSAARNLALDNARGDFVLFLDADDWIEARTAAVLLAHAQGRSGERPGQHPTDIVTYGGACFPVGGWPDSYLATRDITFDDTRAALLGETGAYPLVNKLISRTLLEDAQVRFDPTLSLGEDSAFCFCLFPHAKRVSFVSDKLYHYRWGEAGSAVRAAGSENSRVWAHLLMVRTVSNYWNSQGFFPGYETRFSAWLAELLFRDATMLDSLERDYLAVLLGGILQQSTLDVHLNECDDETRFMLSAMLQAKGVQAKLRHEWHTGGLGSLLRRRLRPLLPRAA